MGRLQDKVILVTGASSGIGWSAAKGFAREGATVIAVSRREDRGNELVEEIKREGGVAAFRTTDIADPSSVDQLFSFIKQNYGRLDGAFNNAGVEGKPSLLPDMELEEFDRVFATNVRGTWVCLRHELRMMRDQRSGVIVNTASAAAVKTYASCSAYVASKHAVVGMSKAASLDAARFGVRVNCILPGGVRTEMMTSFINTHHGGDDSPIAAGVPLRRIGTPEEIASAAIWLLSDESSYVTGAALLIDGGLTVG